MKTDSCKLSDKGFTLIEMAVVIMIIGIVISTVVTLLPTLLQTAKRKETKALLEKYDSALQGYAIANNKLPFADNDGDGREDTDTFVGTLPYLTLGLSAGSDAWKNSIRYAVYGESGGVTNLTSTDATTVCTVLTTASTAAFNSNVVYTTDDDTACTAVDTNSSNKAYALASGGPKDLNTTAGFFDGCNGINAGFNSVNKIQTSDYDDIVIAFSLVELIQTLCSGGGGGGTGGTPGSGSENSDALCSDGIDNDSDGRIDCQDQDCCNAGLTACPGGCPPLDAVAIVTAPDPLPEVESGSLTYNHTFTATGGSGDYFWYIDSITPAIPGFTIDLWTGNLSGGINSCAGSYTINIRVEDRNDSSLTDSHGFTLEIQAASLNIVPQPSGSPDFTIDSSVFETFFTVNEIDGGHVGDFVWTLNWISDDPGGLQINPTSEEGRDLAVSAKLWKSGAVTEGAGTYTFTLTATDSTCAQNTFTSNTYSLSITAGGVNPPYTASMEGQWSFDECDAWSGSNNDVIDSLDSENDQRYFAIASGGVTGTHSGKICRAALFDGADDKIISSVLTGGDIMAFTNEVTLACWFKSPGGGGGYPRLIEFADSTGSYNTSTAIAYDSDGSLRAWTTSEAGVRGASVDYAGELYNDNKWHHAVYTYNAADGGTLYVDGVLKATASDNLTSDIHDAETFVIGGYYPDNSHGFNGMIDEVMVFHTYFTLEEVENLYNITRFCTDTCYSDSIAEYRMENFAWNGTDGEVIDDGSSASHGKSALHGTGILASQTLPSTGKVCRSGVFQRVDASNGSYLDLGDPLDGDLDPGTSPWTISAWVNWDGSTGENIVYNKETLYELRVQSGYVHYAWQPQWAWDGGTSFSIAQDTWVYVTTMYDGQNQILFKNGEEVFSQAVSGSMGANANKFLIGARGHTAPRNFFGGMIDEVKIYDRALSENEIIDDMNETRDCGADNVIISTTSLVDGTIGSAYTEPLEATGGTPPYAWEIIAGGVSTLTLDSFSGALVNLTGTIEECIGEHDLTLRVTDAGSRIDEKTLTLTVNQGALSISPVAGQTFNCTTPAFSQNFTISGPRLNILDNWEINWQGTNPGGFEIIATGDNTAQFRKNGTSLPGSNYLFTISARDSGCHGNSFTSGNYLLNVSGDGEDAPFNIGMTGEWSLDECEWDGTASEIIDTSTSNAHGQSHNINASDIHERSAGKICRAAALNLGATRNQYISLGSDPFQGLEDFSLSMWFRIEDLSTSLSTLFSGASAAHNNAMLIYLNASGTGITTHINDAHRSFTLTSNPDDNLWHHLVWTRNNTTGESRIYIDGILSDSDTDAVNQGEINLDAGGAIIGQEQDSVGGGFEAAQMFQGWIDEVRIFNRVLLAGEVTDLLSLTHDCTSSCYTDAVAEFRMDEASWTGAANDVQDTSGNNNHGTSAGNAQINTSNSHLCNAGQFPGTASNDHIVINDLPVSMGPGDKTTVCFWMNWSGNNTQMPIGWTTVYDLLLYDNNFGINSGGGDVFGVDISGGSMVNSWHHVAAVFTNNPSQPTENQLYIDGILQPSELKFGTFHSRSVTSTLYISGYENNSRYKFGGLMDELRIYNRALSSSEVVEDRDLSHGCVQ